MGVKNKVRKVEDDEQLVRRVTQKELNFEQNQFDKGDFNYPLIFLIAAFGVFIGASVFLLVTS